MTPVLPGLPGGGDAGRGTIPALPDVFLPYQQELWRNVDANPLLAVEKSRRTGFSWALGAIAATYAGMSRAAGGMDALYMGYEKDMTREFIDYVAEWAKSFALAASAVEEFVFKDPDRPDQDIGAFRIRFASGFEVVALPSVPRALRGKQGLVILDEAAFMDDLAEVLKAAMALLIWGGKVVVCSTHNGDTNPFNGLISDIRAGRQKGALQRLTFDEAVAQGLFRRICFTRGKEWTAAGEAAWVAEIYAIYRDNADEELRAIPNPSSGVYLPGPLIEARSTAGIPVVRYEAPAGMATWATHTRDATIQEFCRSEMLPILGKLDPSEPVAAGVDFGRIRDLSVFWFLGIGKDMVRRTRLVVELRNVPFEAQRNILFFVCGGLGLLRALKMDAGGNGAYLAEAALQRYGARVEEVRFSEAWYREQMPPFKAAFEDSMIEVPMDRDIHADLRSLKLIRGVARIAERTRVDETRSRHGDAAIAAALAYYATRAEPEVYEYQGAPPRGRDPDRGGWQDWADEWDDDDDRGRSGGGMLPVLAGGWLG